MKRLFSSETLLIALVAIACLVTATSTAEARWRLLRRPLLWRGSCSSSQPSSPTYQSFRCMDANCPLPQGAFTPLPQTALPVSEAPATPPPLRGASNEPPLPAIVIETGEPADYPPSLVPMVSTRTRSTRN